MQRADLEHIIRAAGSIADAQQLVIIGSQAILGSFPDAPAELTVSAEADIYPLDAPEKADLIGLCLSPTDLAVSKLAAGREKDLTFVRAMLRHGLVRRAQIQSVFDELAEERVALIRPRLERCQAEAVRDAQRPK